jgi:hypothetical protein
MATVRLDGRQIADHRGFHAESVAAFGFPDFYGNNMDAWIDALSYLRDTDSNIAGIALVEEETLVIEVLHSADLRHAAPEMPEMLEDVVAAVNERYEDAGEKPALTLVWR